MPIYTFRCPKCKNQFTDRFPMKDADGKSVICPQCQNKGLQRIFKGSFSIGKESKKSEKQANIYPGCPGGVCPVE